MQKAKALGEQRPELPIIWPWPEFSGSGPAPRGVDPSRSLASGASRGPIEGADGLEGAYHVRTFNFSVAQGALRGLDAEAQRLIMLAKLAGSDLQIVADELRALDRRRVYLAGELKGLADFPALTAKDLNALEAELVKRFADWRAKLRGSVAQAR